VEITGNDAVTVEKGPRPRRPIRPETILIPAMAIVLFGGWELYCRTQDISDLLLPAPSQVVVALIQGFQSGVLLDGLRATFIEIVLGFLLSASFAFVLGTLISQIRVLEATLYPYVVAIQTLPKIAIAPLILVWVGFGIESKVIIAAMVSFFPMLVNNIAGMKSTPPQKIELMRSLSASRWKIFWYLQLPEALPYIFAGLNIGIVLSVLGAIVGEFVGSKEGLGYLIIQMNYSMDIAGVFSALVVLGVMGMAFNLIAQYARRKIIFWQSDRPAFH
jgi:NitT/TauT family transport system permease protein